MKILQLCKKFPFPLKDGEAIAVTFLSKALSELGCEITLLSMNTRKHYSNLSKIPNDFDHYQAIHTTDIDTSLNLKDAFLNLFSSQSYHVSRFIDGSFENRLIEILKSQKFDVVQLETLYLAPYMSTIKANSDALITMRAHNVEFEIWERITRNTRFLPKKLYLNYLTKKLKRFELDQLNHYDYLVSVTEKDLLNFQRLGYKNGAISSPIGLDTRRYPSSSVRNGSGLKLCFIGSLDWRPNIEGFNWFVKEVWPLIHKKYPQIELHVAGRNTPSYILNMKKPNMFIHGEVNDAIDFINECDVMVVPLFSGSGMRVKILEGMALAKVVVSTKLGLEGIDAEDGEEVLIANDPISFVKQIGYCAKYKEELYRIGNSARDFVKTYYDNKQNAEKLLKVYEKLVNEPYPQY